MHIVPTSPSSPLRSDAILKPWEIHAPTLEMLVGQVVHLEDRSDRFPQVIRVIGRLVSVKRGFGDLSPYTLDLLLSDNTPYTCRVNDLNWIELASPIEPDD